MLKNGLFKKLPAIYQNKINQSLFGNAVDHLLSADTQLQMSTIVGSGTNVVESSPRRRADQIQPYMVSELGSETVATSFEDVIEWLTRAGVDVDRIADWANQARFAFKPPFDLDKFNNFSDYYWVNDTLPDYITIKNRYRQLAVYCNTIYREYPSIKALCETVPRTLTIAAEIESLVPGFAGVHDEYVAYLVSDPTNTINETSWDARPWDEFGQDTYQQLVDGLAIISHGNDLGVPGDYSTILTTSNPFVVSVTKVDGSTIQQVVTSAVYDQSNDITIITTSPSLPEDSIGGRLYVANFVDLYSYDAHVEVGTGYIPTRLQRDDWSSANSWVHVSELSSYANLSKYHRAELPIIEFDAYINMCAWYKIERDWYYNNAPTGSGPLKTEMVSHQYIETPTIAYGNRVHVSSRFVSRLVELSLSEFTVQVGSVYTYAKKVNVEPVSPTNFYEYILETDISFDSVDITQIKLHPMRFSSKGDNWEGFTNHWSVGSVTKKVPIYAPEPMLTGYDFLNENDPYRIVHNGQRVDTITTQSAEIEILPIVSPMGLPYYPTISSETIRVYINDRRLLSGFTPGILDPITNVFEPVTDVYTRFNAIKLDTPVRYSTVYICVGAFTNDEWALTGIPVNVRGLGIREMDLYDYTYIEQQKTEVGQYPLFNEFDASGNHTGLSTTIWEYVRSSTAPVNAYIGDRVELNFENRLVDGGTLKFVRKKDSLHGNATDVGCWERAGNSEPSIIDGEALLLEQSKYNPDNTTRQYMRYEYTLSHFNEIIESQPREWHVQLKGIPVPGSVRLYSGCYDWLWAYVHADMPNVPELLASAKDQYVRGLSRVRQIVRDTVSNVTFSDPDAFYATVRDSLKQGNAYIPDTSSGVPGIIDTPCTFGWLRPTVPGIVEFNGSIILTHHDGHDSSIVVSEDEHDLFVTAMMRDGYIVTNSLPTIFGTVSQIGYIVDRAVYRVKPDIEFVATLPATPVRGVVYANISTQQVSFYDNNTLITTSDQSACWNKYTLKDVIADITLRVERELYATSMQHPTFRYIDPHNGQMAKYIQAFVRRAKLDPSVTTDYDANNPFTWNYADYMGVQNSRWYTIYQNSFGTRFPHREPWKILGYTDKPNWWDGEFKDLTGTRVWQQRMWSYVRQGCVPSGKISSTGVVSSGKPGDVGYTGQGRVSVSTVIPVYDQDYGIPGYSLDELLPPSFPGTGPQFDYIRMVNNYSANSARKPYVVGANGPLEDVWRRSVDASYDRITEIWRQDPIDVFSDISGFMFQTTTSGLKLVDGKLPNRTDLSFHGDATSSGSFIHYNGLLQYAMLCLRDTGIDADFVGKRLLLQTPEITFGYPVSGFVSDHVVRVLDRKSNNQYGYVGNELIVKKSTHYNELGYTALRCYVGNAPTSEIRAGVRVPVGKGDDWEFVMVSMNASISSVTLYKPTGGTSSVFDFVANGSKLSFSVGESSRELVQYTIGTSIADADPLFRGVQGLLTFMNCYEQYLLDSGIIMDASVDTANGSNYGTLALDALSSIYGGMGSSVVTPFLGIWHPVQPIVGTGNLQTVSGHKFKIGQQVQLFSTGKLPVSVNESDAYEITHIDGNIITLSGVVFGSLGQGFMSAGLHRVNITTPVSFFEFNPFRNVVKIATPRGLMSPVGKGTVVYDQFGDVIEPRGLTVHRMDDSTEIQIRPGLINPKFNMESAIGGINVAIDTWEHVILFDSESIEGEIWFEPSLGAFTPSLTISGRYDLTTKMRPRVGGAFLRGGQMESNISTALDVYADMYEPSASDIHPIIEAGRRTYGFEEFQWMTDLGITTQTQFRFYQQMARNVGLTESVKALINSKYFVNATVDEVWAYNSASYGSTPKLEYVDINPVDMIVYGDVVLVDLKQEVHALDGAGDRGIVTLQPNILDTRVHMGHGTVRFDKQYTTVEARYVVEPYTTRVCYMGSFACNLITDLHEVVCSDDDGNELAVTVTNGIVEVTVPYGTYVILHATGRRLHANEYHSYPGYGIIELLPTVSANEIRITIYGHTSAHRFIEVVDRDTDHVYSRLSIWDPASGLHNERALTSIDFVGQDPALYDDGKRMWTRDRLSTVWWANESISYKPYHDVSLYDDVEKITAWGEQTKHSISEVYEWVSSPHHPSVYGAEMAKTGSAASAYRQVAYRLRPSASDPFGPWLVDQKQVFTITGYALAQTGSLVALPYEKCDLYIDGEYQQTVVGTVGNPIAVVAGIRSVVEFVKPIHTVTEDDLKFDPIKRDDGRLVQYGYIYPCNTEVKVNQYGNEVTVHYFWAKNTSSGHGPDNLSTTRLLSMLHDCQRSFAFYMNIVESSYTTVALLGAGVIADSKAIRLRGETAPNVETRFSEWELIRPGQRTVIVRTLWDKLISAMVGTKVVDGELMTEKLPRIDLILSDELNGTNNTFGLWEGQIMCTSDDAIEALNAILLNPSVNLYPVDRVSFIAMHDLSTAQGMVTLMNAVYNTFSPQYVNTIWFNALQSGMARNRFYEGIMKTSYIHLDSVQTLSM